LTRELSIEERDAEWLRGKTSMRDVQDALLAAQEAYRDKAKASKARAWLAACSSRVMYYSCAFGCSLPATGCACGLTPRSGV